MSDKSQGEGWWLASDGRWYPPESRPSPPPLPPPVGAPTPPTTGTPSNDQLIGIGAGALGVVGAFLPWASVTTAFGTISVDGINGDGLISAIAAIVGGIASWRGSGSAIVLLLLAGLVVGGVGGYHYYTLEDDLTAGVGLYLTCLSGLVLFVVGARLRADST